MGGRASDAVWRRWSAGDDAELRACLARGDTLRGMTLALGRTQAAVDCRNRCSHVYSNCCNRRIMIIAEWPHSVFDCLAGQPKLP